MSKEAKICDALSKLWLLQFEPPKKPGEYVRLLSSVRTQLMNVTFTERHKELLKPSVQHVLYIWESEWPRFLEVDVYFAVECEGLYPNMICPVFALLSLFVVKGVIGKEVDCNIPSIRGYQEIRELIPVKYQSRHVSSFDINEMQAVLYNIERQWFSLNHGHHECLEMVFPAMLVRLCHLFEDEEVDIDDVWTCEIYLRRMYWPMAIRNRFEIALISDLRYYNESNYSDLYNKTFCFIRTIMNTDNRVVIEAFQNTVTMRWEMPSTRELIARMDGIPSSRVSREKIHNEIPSSTKVYRLDVVAGERIMPRIYNGPNNQFRHTLIAMTIVSSIKSWLNIDIGERIKNSRHLWDVANISKLVKSTSPYMLQISGSYVTVCNGKRYISTSIEEAFAQFLYLFIDIDSISNFIRNQPTDVNLPIKHLKSGIKKTKTSIVINA